MIKTGMNIPMEFSGVNRGQIPTPDYRAGKTAISGLKIQPAKMMLVIGGEHKAVGQLILNTAHYVVKIPISGKISSLNASVAAGIALYLTASSVVKFT